MLGGQHIVYALQGIVQELIDKGKARDSIAANLRTVQAEILKYGTRVEICRHKAGEHQLLQHDVQEISTADVARFLEVVCASKKRTYGVPWLTDAELFEALQNCGLVRGDPQMIKSYNDAGELPSKDLMKQWANEQVCFLYFFS